MLNEEYNESTLSTTTDSEVRSQNERRNITDASPSRISGEAARLGSLPLVAPATSKRDWLMKNNQRLDALSLLPNIHTNPSMGVVQLENTRTQEPLNGSTNRNVPPNTGAARSLRGLLGTNDDRAANSGQDTAPINTEHDDEQYLINSSTTVPIQNTAQEEENTVSIPDKPTNSLLASILVILILAPCIFAAFAQMIYLWKKRKRDRAERELLAVGSNPAGRRVVLEQIFQDRSRAVTKDECPRKKEKVLVKKRRKRTPAERSTRVEKRADAIADSPAKGMNSDSEIDIEKYENKNNDLYDTKSRGRRHESWWKEEDVLTITGLTIVSDNENDRCMGLEKGLVKGILRDSGDCIDDKHDCFLNNANDQLTPNEDLHQKQDVESQSEKNVTISCSAEEVTSEESQTERYDNAPGNEEEESVPCDQSNSKGETLLKIVTNASNDDEDIYIDNSEEYWRNEDARGQLSLDDGKEQFFDNGNKDKTACDSVKCGTTDEKKTIGHTEAGLNCHVHLLGCQTGDRASHGHRLTRVTGSMWDTEQLANRVLDANETHKSEQQLNTEEAAETKGKCPATEVPRLSASYTSERSNEILAIYPLTAIPDLKTDEGITEPKFLVPKPRPSRFFNSFEAGDKLSAIPMKMTKGKEETSMRDMSPLQSGGTPSMNAPDELTSPPQGIADTLHPPTTPTSPRVFNDAATEMVSSVESTTEFLAPASSNRVSTQIFADQAAFGLILPALKEEHDDDQAGPLTPVPTCKPPIFKDSNTSDISYAEKERATSRELGPEEFLIDVSGDVPLKNDYFNCPSYQLPKIDNSLSSKSFSRTSTADAADTFVNAAASTTPSYRLERSYSGASAMSTASNLSGGLSGPMPLRKVGSHVTDSSSISYFSYEDMNVDDDESDTCAICLCSYEEGDVKIFSKHCTHVFHKDCIFEWLVNGRDECPCCRTDMVTKSEVRETSASLVGTERLAQAMAAASGLRMVEAQPPRYRRPRLPGRMLARGRISHPPENRQAVDNSLPSPQTPNGHWLWSARFNNDQQDHSPTAGLAVTLSTSFLNGRSPAHLSPSASTNVSAATSPSSPSSTTHAHWLWTTKFQNASQSPPNNVDGSDLFHAFPTVASNSDGSGPAEPAATSHSITNNSATQPGGPSFLSPRSPITLSPRCTNMGHGASATASPTRTPDSH